MSSASGWQFQMAVHTSPIRWAGSKRLSIPILTKFFPSTIDRYVEPFCGSAALFFHLTPKRAILSDLNAELISFYKLMKREPAQVYKIATSVSRTEKAYYKARDAFNIETDPLRRAGLFYYLNKNCFNGLYRTSQSGNFNVPFSRNRIGRYPSEEEFVEVAKSFKNARFQCGDFEQAIRRDCRENDFVFLDPPYSEAKRYPFREYYPECFKFSDVERLEQLLRFIDDQGAQFVLTFSNSLTIKYRSRNWKKFKVRTRRNISGFADSRKFVDDVILTNVRKAYEVA